MQIGRIHSWKKVTAQLLLLAVPTVALVFYFIVECKPVLCRT